MDSEQEAPRAADPGERAPDTGAPRGRARPRAGERAPEQESPESPEAERARLIAENAELQRQLAKAPPRGPDKGAAVCFRRVNETICRPAVVLSDGYVESVSTPRGVILHALIEYRDPAGAPDRMAMVGSVEKAVAHGFQTNRGHSPGGEPDTWHLPSECPWGHDPAVCPFKPEPPPPKPPTP